MTALLYYSPPVQVELLTLVLLLSGGNSTRRTSRSWRLNIRSCVVSTEMSSQRYFLFLRTPLTFLLTGFFFAGSANDVTVLKESEEKLKQQQQQESARRENILVMRLATKEQEMQECTVRVGASTFLRARL